MSARIRLATAAGGEPWEVALTEACQQPGASVEVVQRCYDLDELLAAATGGQIAVAVVSADLPELGHGALARLTATGVAVVGVTAPGDEPAELRLRQLGIDHVAAADVPPQKLAALAEQAAARPASTGRELALQEPGGRILAVWGPKGAPGRTTIALNLAFELATLTDDLLLVDADTYGGAVAVALGILEVPADLFEVAQLADRGTLDGLRLRAVTQVAAAGPRILTGLPHAQGWTAIRPATWELLLGLFRRTFALTVLDLAATLEEEEELVYDHVHLRRNAVTRLTLQHADAVVAVARADPVGLHHFISAYPDLLELGVDARRVRVVVNQVRADRFAGEHQAEIRAELIQRLGVDPVAYVPYDRRALDQAASSTRALAEVCSWSPVTREIAALARILLQLQPDHTRRRAALWRTVTGRLRPWRVQPS
jgi:Flp pilus assembly CpaE family ATPase